MMMMVVGMALEEEEVRCDSLSVHPRSATNVKQKQKPQLQPRKKPGVANTTDTCGGGGGAGGAEAAAAEGGVLWSIRRPLPGEIGIMWIGCVCV